MRFLLDKNTRDDDRALARGARHLDNIYPSTVTTALREDRAFVEQQREIELLKAQCTEMAAQVNMLKADARNKTHSIIDKSGKLRPNPDHTYPRESQPATPDIVIKANTQLTHAIKVIEKSMEFKESPYNYMLEVLGASNNVAFNYGLTKNQQLKLITNTIPPTHAIANELSLLNTLDEVFDLVSTNSSLLMTKSELEAKIEMWRLNTSSHDGVSESLAELKRLILQHSDQPAHSIDQQVLYREVIQRVRREKLPAYMYRALDEARSAIDRESLPLELHNLVLATLKQAVKPKPNLQVHAIETEQVTPPATQQNPYSPLTDNTTLQLCKMIFDNTNKTVAEGVTKAKGKKGEPKDKGKNGKAPQPAKSQATKGDTKPKGKNGSKLESVGPWPVGANYLNSSGTKLLPEIEAHFKGCCHKCGLKNHKSNECQRYTDRTAVLTLCQTCRRGFHSPCKHPFFRQRSDYNVLVNTIRDSMARGAATGGNYYPFPPPPIAALTHNPTLALTHEPTGGSD